MVEGGGDDLAKSPRNVCKAEWAVAFPLVVVSLGVSPREALMQQWQAIVDVIIAKFKVGGCVSRSRSTDRIRTVLCGRSP